jgi:hypothetical protein
MNVDSARTHTRTHTPARTIAHARTHARTHDSTHTHAHTHARENPAGARLRFAVSIARAMLGRVFSARAYAPTSTQTDRRRHTHQPCAEQSRGGLVAVRTSFSLLNACSAFSCLRAMPGKHRARSMAEPFHACARMRLRRLLGCHGIRPMEIETRSFQMQINLSQIIV